MDWRKQNGLWSLIGVSGLGSKRNHMQLRMIGDIIKNVDVDFLTYCHNSYLTFHCDHDSIIIDFDCCHCTSHHYLNSAALVNVSLS